MFIFILLEQIIIIIKVSYNILCTKFSTKNLLEFEYCDLLVVVVVEFVMFDFALFIAATRAP